VEVHGRGDLGEGWSATKCRCTHQFELCWSRREVACYGGLHWRSTGWIDQCHKIPTLCLPEKMVVIGNFASKLVGGDVEALN